MALQFDADVAASEKTDESIEQPADAVMPGNVDVMKRLLEAGAGLVKLVTLAPECDAGLRDKLWTCFIADGVHVPAVALRNYLDLCGCDRSIIVTDAIAPAGLGPGRYTLGRWDVSIGDDLVARSPDGAHFIGSATTMRQAHANLRAMGLNESECRALLSENARRAIPP